MTWPEPRGASIRIFLVDGTPQGLRLVERMGWTGSCLAFARADYAEARTRPELGRTGVYLLVGPDPDFGGALRAYIGEADELRTRLDSHQREKDFWTHAYALTTKDSSLNKAHARYLETRLLEIARATRVARLDNGTAPPRPNLTEPEIADMESYLRESLTLFPLVGVSIFDLIEETPSGPEQSPAGSSGRPDGGHSRLYLQTDLTAAEGREDPRGFLVYSGSLGRAQVKVMMPTYEAIRNRLVTDGLLMPVDNGQLRLTENFMFDSPSAAASVMAGGSKNGRTAWRDRLGRTLKDIQSSAADQPIAEATPVAES